MSGHLDVERLKESDRSGSETSDSTCAENNGMSGRENKPPRVPDLEVPMFSDKSKKMKPMIGKDSIKQSSVAIRWNRTRTAEATFAFQNAHAHAISSHFYNIY